MKISAFTVVAIVFIAGVHVYLPYIYTQAVQTVLTDFTTNDPAVFVVPKATFSYCTLIEPGIGIYCLDDFPTGIYMAE